MHIQFRKLVFTDFELGVSYTHINHQPAKPDWDYKITITLIKWIIHILF